MTPRKLPGLGEIRQHHTEMGRYRLDGHVQLDAECDPRQSDRKTVTIIAINEEGADVATWQVIEAWPSKYTAPNFNATGNEVAIEFVGAGT